MTWFAAMLVVIDWVSTSVQELHMQKEAEVSSNVDAAASIHMPTFHMDGYFADRDSMVTQKVQEFPQSAGWQKLRAPVRNDHV